MPTIARTGSAQRKPPSWCKPGIWGLIPPLITGLPVRLVVYARWRQKIYGQDTDAIESFQLSYNAETKDWSGASSDRGENLLVDVCLLDEPGHYDVSLTLRYGTSEIDSYCWHDTVIEDKRPFDTGELKFVMLVDDWFYVVRARG